MIALGFYIAAIVLFLAMVRSARAFARRQQEAGRWDENGPLDSTPAPPFPGNVYASGLDAFSRAWERRNGPEGAINIVEELPSDDAPDRDRVARRTELN